MRDLGRILLLWRARWPLLAAGVVVSLAALAAGIALVGASGGAVAASLLGLGLGAAVTLRVFGPARVLLRYAERLLTHDATFRALADLRVWFFRGVAGGAAGGLGFSRAGDVLARLVGDVETLDGLYLRILVPLAGCVLLLVALVLLAAPLGLVLALVLAALFALCAFVLPAFGMRAARAGGAAVAVSRGEMRVAALDALTGLREVRAFGAEGRVLAQVQAREAAMLGAARALARDAAWGGAAALFCGQMGLVAVLGLAMLTPAGRAHPWAVVVLAFVTTAAFEAASGLPRAGVLAGHAAAAAGRVLSAATAPAPVPDPVAPDAPPVASGLRFEAVGFSWQPDRAAVFDGLTLDIPEGSRVALLGPSGSGKSTLAALALKVAAPQSGRVLLGGVDVARLTATDVRARAGWLSQATHLFDDSLHANLLLARPDADDAALWQALDTARVADFVRTLPDGLDSWLGEGGARVSGGQARRLALARALLSPARLLLLDEPCAGLDAETEREFFATLNQAAAGRTVLLIVHRLTGVEKLDRIYRLSGGRAVAAAR
jgi:ATP-binding cassette subfamily C protein CydC